MRREAHHANLQDALEAVAVRMLTLKGEAWMRENARKAGVVAAKVDSVIASLRKQQAKAPTGAKES